jgi:RNA polymerase-binding transcription factor DksA
MKQADLERYHDRLTALYHRLRGDVSSLEEGAYRQTGGEASGNLSNMPLHMADLGSDTFEQQVTLSLLENEENQLLEITDALERIRRGTFGRCEACGKEIAAERLDAVPYTRYCAADARKVQADARADRLGSL